MRLSSLEHMSLPEPAREDITAICEACEYLKRLSRGLRLFAMSPDDSHAAGETTDLLSWWSEVAPFLRNALPRPIQFDGNVTAGLPEVCISPHLLTQAIYNLVQNAGDAMRELSSGRVTLEARPADDGRHIVLSVADNGPGMSEEVLRRCMEPFYTTKSRGISTGLGLALVRGAVYNAGGSIEVQSQPGKGTTFHVSLRAALRSECDEAPADETPRAACISLRDPRLAAYVSSILRALKVSPVTGPWSAGAPVSLVVLDDAGERLEELRAFLDGDVSRAALAIGDAVVPSARVVTLGRNPSASQIRSGLLRLFASQPESAVS
jgi:hypothetical protein